MSRHGRRAANKLPAVAYAITVSTGYGITPPVPTPISLKPKPDGRRAYRVKEFCQVVPISQSKVWELIARAPHTARGRARCPDGEANRSIQPAEPAHEAGQEYSRQHLRGHSTELDALPARVLRGMVRKCIERHITHAALKALREAEASERQLIEAWAGEVGGAS